MKPFLKWAGGKYRIIDKIQAVLPIGKRLVEPFVGSGAVFLNTNYPSYLLADANPDLINVYVHLKEADDIFIEECKKYFISENNTSNRYYELRDIFNTTTDSFYKATLFIYLNRHCYNGLCRYNSKGLFNVPFGKYSNPRFPQPEMKEFHVKSRCAEFVTQSFQVTMDSALVGDVIYCDPPYAPLSRTSSFTSYSAVSFGLNEQEILAQKAIGLAEKGITVVISNHDTDYTRVIYSNAKKLFELSVQRNISANSSSRNRVAELLAVFDSNNSACV